jgi:hypothetical protein
MSEMFATYLVAIGAMLFSALSALTLNYSVDHLDLPGASPEHVPEQFMEKVAV